MTIHETLPAEDIEKAFLQAVIDLKCVIVLDKIDILSGATCNLSISMIACSIHAYESEPG